jgi:hypothetical protein
LTLILLISSASVAAVNISPANTTVKPTGNSSPTGTIILSGGDEVASIIRAAKPGFEMRNPCITLDIRTTTDAQGLSEVINGNCDIAMYSYWYPFNPVNYNSMPVQAEKWKTTVTTAKESQESPSRETPLSAFQGIAFAPITSKQNKYKLCSRNSLVKTRFFKGAV